MAIITETIITSLSIIGFYYSTYYELDSEGNPTEKAFLWFVRFYGVKLLGQKWSKPVVNCPKCMASVWGFLFFIFVFHHNIGSLDNCIYIAIFILMVSAVNNIIHKFIES